MKYTLRHFIDKFKSIPYEQWSTNACIFDADKKDFMGHLDSYPNRVSEEGNAFVELTVGFIPDPVGRVIILYMINDGEDRFAKMGANRSSLS